MGWWALGIGRWQQEVASSPHALSCGIGDCRATGAGGETVILSNLVQTSLLQVLYFFRVSVILHTSIQSQKKYITCNACVDGGWVLLSYRSSRDSKSLRDLLCTCSSR